MGRAVRAVPTGGLRPAEADALRRLFEAAWEDDEGDFTAQDWENAMGGVHFVLEDDGEIRSHASVVERELHAGEHRLRTGYVEAVATWPAHQRRGFATEVMRAVGAHIDETFDLGALDTGLPGFYSRLGWEEWDGPTFIRTAGGLVRTADEDGAVMVRRTPRTPTLDSSAPISCDWRPGDVW